MPLPPNPRHSIQVQSQETSSIKGFETEATPPVPIHTVGSQTSISKSHSLSDPMTLQQLVNEYSDRFPLPIKVVQGYEGETSQLCLSNSDIYNVHFVQHRHVVSIRDGTGSTYSVPLNSSAQFGIVYKSVETRSAEGNKADTLRNPPRFHKISDIVALDNRLPTVVCATKPYQGSDEKSSVQENEVLIVLGVHKTKLRVKKGLQVLSLRTRKQKCLPLDCSGHFSTDPFLVRMHLPEIVGYMSNPFPCQAVLFLGSDFESCSEHISDSLLTGSVTLIESKVETSLIVSAVINPVDGIVPKELAEFPHLDIPLDDCLTGVEVAMMDMDDSDVRERLYESTRHLLETLDLSKVKSCKETGSELSYSTQSALYATYQHGREKYGIEVDIPPAAFQHAVQLPPQTPGGFMKLAEQHTILETMESNNAYESVPFGEVELNSSISSMSDELENEASAPEYIYDSVEVVHPNTRNPTNASSSNQVYDEVSSRPERAVPGNPRERDAQSGDTEAHPPVPYMLLHPNSHYMRPSNEPTSGYGPEIKALRLAVKELTKRVGSLESQMKGFVEPSSTSEMGASLDRSREAGNVSHLQSLNCQQVSESNAIVSCIAGIRVFGWETETGDCTHRLWKEENIWSCRP